MNLVTPAWQVAVDTPAHSGLSALLDYLPPPGPAGAAAAPPGALVRVPLGARTVLGVVWGEAPEPEPAPDTGPRPAADAAPPPATRLRPVAELWSALPPLPAPWRALVGFAAAYYQRAVGELALAALPPEFRKLDGVALGRRLKRLHKERERALASQADAAAGAAPALAAVAPSAASAESLAPIAPAAPAAPVALGARPPLTPQQQAALDEIAALPPGGVALLHGATGSGKTEVYLREVERALTAGRQALVLVPEINLTPQLLARFTERFGPHRVVALHSGLTEAQRVQHWLQAHLGWADVVLGTRLAIFTPLARLGLIVVDEEHEPSYKQQEGARYSARDLAVYRGRLEGVPVILGSATPSLESWFNALPRSQPALDSGKAGAHIGAGTLAGMQGGALQAGGPGPDGAKPDGAEPRGPGPRGTEPRGPEPGGGGRNGDGPGASPSGAGPSGAGPGGAGPSGAGPSGAGRYRLVSMPARVGGGGWPALRFVDLGREKLMGARARLPGVPGGAGPAASPGSPTGPTTPAPTSAAGDELPLAAPLLQALAERTARGEQSLVLLNRRGYAPVLHCADCGWKSACPHCSAWRVFHKADRTLRCHHCGLSERVPRACPECGNLDIRPMGRGTERLEEQLAQALPGARVARIDADVSRQRGALEARLASVHAGEVDVLVGTQMVAKGHDFRRITLVAAVNPDAALFSSDFRAPERLFALLMQAAGRAGRDAQVAARSEMWVQTWHPQHPLYAALAAHDYIAYASAQLAERRVAGLPPYSHLALLRAEARDPQWALAFLRQAGAAAAALLAEAPPPGAGQAPPVQIYPPVPTPVARVAGVDRAQMLLESPSRTALQRLLAQLGPTLHELARASRAAKTPVLRWAIDVDPLAI